MMVWQGVNQEDAAGAEASLSLRSRGVQPGGSEGQLSGMQQILNGSIALWDTAKVAKRCRSERISAGRQTDLECVSAFESQWSSYRFSRERRWGLVCGCKLTKGKAGMDVGNHIGPCGQLSIIQSITVMSGQKRIRVE
ncbi:unnamed protein product [Protopolystoma xenopodis]|uniref:Uncharacterized protein n=1 Tax=Protopolystoma xenopodis TaxID=117903 RepID=A0A3S5FEG3_9PLAT|nr:unnamed protein product [Protopolystoma xenopodis]